MVHDMQAKFDKYWSEYNLALSCATILDPRYKVTFFKYCFVKIYGNDGVGDRVEKVINTLRMWFEEYMRPPLVGHPKTADHLLLVRVVISLMMTTKLSWMIGLCLSPKRQHMRKWVRVSLIYT